MDSTSLGGVVDDLDSTDKKRRLRGLEALEETLRRGLPDDDWQQVVAPLIGTLRDNNFKVCRAALCCLESLVGHVDSNIVPFLSAMVPAVVECLGNTKTPVQEKGVDLLLAVTSPAVNGVHDTLSMLEAYFRHKNRRVREYLVKYLGRATEVDGAGIAGRSSLAVMLADALNDSASQVRQEALSVTAGVVRLTGSSLLVRSPQHYRGYMKHDERVKEPHER